MKRLLIIGLCAFVMLNGAGAQTIEARVEDMLAGMSLEHKVGQMFMVTLHGSVVTEAGTAHLRRWQPGGLVLFSANVGTPDAVARLTNGYQAVMREAGAAPLLVSIDQEGGVVTRLTEGFTFLPTPLLLTASGMSEAAGRMMGGELAAVGINMNLAPVADLETFRDNPIIARRAFGGDPLIAGGAVADYVRGLQARGVLATAKHFPGHGETRQDSHAVLPTLELTRDRLDSTELVPFRMAIEADTAAVMVSHIWFPALDPIRRPASLSPLVVNGLLRGEMGYDGLIMTDALDMNAVDLEINYYDAVVLAVEAGIDLLATGPSTGIAVVEAAMQRVVDEVRAGRISEARIDQSVRRILTTKARFGVLDAAPVDAPRAAAAVAAEGGTALVESLYRASVTVAVDRAGLVPIAPETRVAVIFLATRYQIQAECSAYRPGGRLVQWVGVNDNPTAEQIGWATAAARAADVVVVWTQNADRNPDQAALVRALPPEKTIAVALWSPYDWQVYPDVSTYLALYSPGRPAVPAACAVLFGAAPSTGQLPLTLGEMLRAGSGE